MSEQRTSRVTIRDIAERAGVSKGAVSYALNGRPGVSDDTRGRILSIADELGWYPNRAARALSASRADACGLVLARPARTLALEPFFMEFIAGVEVELSSRSVALTLQLVDDARQEIDVYRRWWGEHRVDGVLMVDLRVDDPRVDELVRLGLPAVVVGGPLENRALPAVFHDEASVVVDAVHYLAALGHARIAHVTGVARLCPHETTERGVRARNDGSRAPRRHHRNRLQRRAGYSCDAEAPLAARSADGDRVRQRLARSHGARSRAADGLLGPRRRVDRRMGRLADQPGRPPAADGDHPRRIGFGVDAARQLLAAIDGKRPRTSKRYGASSRHAEARVARDDRLATWSATPDRLEYFRLTLNRISDELREPMRRRIEPRFVHPEGRTSGSLGWYELLVSPARPSSISRTEASPSTQTLQMSTPERGDARA